MWPLQVFVLAGNRCSRKRRIRRCAALPRRRPGSPRRWRRWSGLDPETRPASAGRPLLTAPGSPACSLLTQSFDCEAWISSEHVLCLISCDQPDRQLRGTKYCCHDLGSPIRSLYYTELWIVCRCPSAEAVSLIGGFIGELVGFGYGPSHTWEGYWGHSGSSAAGVGSALCLQAERLQGVFGCVDFSFFNSCTQFSWCEGMTADTQFKSCVNVHSSILMSQFLHYDR